MAVNKEIPRGIRQATQLTRAGLLFEATALIQRNLAHGPRVAAAAYTRRPERDGGASNEVIDVEFSDAVPANHGQASVQRSAADGLSRRLNLKSFLRGRHEREDPLTVPGSQPAEGQPGQFITGCYANAAGARPYKLYIPTTYAQQPLPLVVMLHGCTQTPDDFANGTRMNALAEEQRCFVLYPGQTHAANHSRCWNWFKRGDQRRDQGEPAILAGMTREILGRYRIDPGKVYVAGLSAGGAMAAVMAVAYPELYAAAGVHSGLPCGSAHDVPSALSAMRGVLAPAGHNTGLSPPAAATPTIVFHGDRDKTVHPRNGEQVISQLAGQNGASEVRTATERGQVPGGHAFTRTVHRDLNGRIILEHWLVHDGGHAWFGGSSRGSHVDPKGPDAAREMMRFFHNISGD